MSSPFGAFHTPSPGQRHEPLAHFVEVARRQNAVGYARGSGTGDLANVETRPKEVVDLLQHDPGSLAIEFEQLLDAGRNFDGGLGIGGRGMGDGKEVHPGASLHRRRCQNYGARPVFPALFPSSIELSTPEE